jgi:ribosomal protein S2
MKEALTTKLELDYSDDLIFSHKFSNPVIETFSKRGLFEADYMCKTHYSQYPYLLGIKNSYFFYDIEKSLFLFGNAVKFLKSMNLETYVNFIFAGSPQDQKKKLEKHFDNFDFKCTFFSNTLWPSGYISKSALDKNSVLIIYNINLNLPALREAVIRGIPVVGFATPSCDIRGVDYPILLNFRKIPLIYLKILVSIFKESK